MGDHQWLRGHNLFVAEGRLVVARLLDGRSRFPIRSVLLSPAALAALELSNGADFPVYVADQQILNAITGFNFHRGCLALAERPAPVPLPALGQGTLVLACEGIGNPDNVGGLFRVAAAFGASGVLLDASSGDPLYRKSVRTSMGAVLRVPFVVSDDITAALRHLRSSGFRIVALTPRADALPVQAFERSPGTRLVVLVGAEGPGLTPAALDQADIHLRIPMADGVDSLNVVVAAGVALSHLV